MEAAWNQVKVSIKEQIPIHSFKMWIEPIRFLSFKDKTITLSCPNNFSKKRLHDQYISLIETQINSISEKECKIIVEVSGENGNSKQKTDDNS